MASQQEVSMSDSHFPEPSSKERKPPLVARETADEGDGELEKVRTSWAQGTVGKRGHRGSSTSDTVNFESEVDYKAKLPRRRKMSGCWGLSGFSWTFLLLALAQALIIIGLQITIAILGDFRADQLEQFIPCLERSLNVNLTNSSSIPSFGQDKEIYVYFFMSLVLYNLGLCIYALKVQNIVEVFTFLIINVLAMIYACVQVYQFRGFGTECPTITLVGYLALANALFLLGLTFVFGVLSFFIYVEFGWKIYKLINCNSALRYYYRVYEVLMSGAKILILFMIIFFVGQAILILQTNYETWIIILLILVCLALYPFTYVVVRRESHLGAIVLVVVDIAVILYCIFKVVRFTTLTCPLCRIAVNESETDRMAIEEQLEMAHIKDDLDLSTLFRAEHFEHLVMIGVMNIITALFLMAIFFYLWCHYGRGLKQYFATQPALPILKFFLKAGIGQESVDGTSEGKHLIRLWSTRHRKKKKEESRNRESGINEATTPIDAEFTAFANTGIPAEPGDGVRSYNLAPIEEETA